MIGVRSILCIGLLVVAGCASLGESPPSTARQSCLIPPAFDPGVGELYVCDVGEGEGHLIDYARRSHDQNEAKEDIWVLFQGVFGNRVWINIGDREANDASLPALELLPDLIEQMQRIKAGDDAALGAFLAPLERTPASTPEEGALKARLLGVLRNSATQPVGRPIQFTVYHVHLKPTREIEKRSVMPINHLVSLPSHTDLLYAQQIDAMAAELGAKAEHRIAVPAGIWRYRWDAEAARRFVQTHYDGPSEVADALKYAHAYTKFAISEYHRLGLNEAAGMNPDRVRAYQELLRQTGAVLHFAFAPDWSAYRARLTEQ
jgi:hypothetical protein